MTERDMIIRECEYWVNNHKDEDLLLAYSAVVELLVVLKEQPELVRCKDCKHWEQYSDVPTIGNCPVLDKSRRFNWFCADGEMKGEKS